MKFIMATNNNHKVVEFSRILKPLGIEAVSAKEESITLDDVDETGTTFAENARIKALAAYKKTGMPAIADDSGLSVDALNGRPGVYSARYAGENATDADKIKKLLSELADVPDDKRTAHFTSAICCVIDSENIIEVEGVCNGKISHSPIGESGFGYDPIFMFGDKSYAQLSPQEKDAVSHRGKSLAALEKELNKYLNN